MFGYTDSFTYQVNRRIAAGLLSFIRNSWFYRWLLESPQTESYVFGSSRVISGLAGFFGLFIGLFHNKRFLSPLLFLAILLCLCIYFYSAPLMFYILGAVLLFAVVWVKIEIGFVLLIFSLALSRKMVFPGISPDAGSLYFSDFMVAVIFLVTLFRILSGKQKPAGSPLDYPIIIYLCIAIISAVRGMLVHTIDSPVISLLYLFKQIEYFLIFYLVLNHISNVKQVKLYVFSWLIAACVISIYGIYEHFHPIEYLLPHLYYRIYERGWFQGQTNHFAGYLMLFICIAISFLLYSRRLINKLRFSGLTLLMLPALLWTYSRQAYISLGAALTGLFMLKNKKILIILLLILILIMPVLSPHKVRARLYSVFRAFKIDDPNYSSVACRIHNWRMALKEFPRYPLLGVGLGARHRAFYDSQYILILSELGLAGLFCFLGLLLSIFKQALHSFWQYNHIFLKALSLGIAAGVIGISVQSITCVTFIITRIAGPFCFLLGLIVSCGQKDISFAVNIQRTPLCFLPRKHKVDTKTRKKI